MLKKSRKKAVTVKKSGFSERLAAVRLQHGMTLMELADKAHVHFSHIQRIESGKSQPTVEILKRIAEALDVSTDLLIFDRLSDFAASRLSDKELIDQFKQVELFNEQDKLAIKTVLSAMIIKHKLHSVLPSATSTSTTGSATATAKPSSLPEHS